MAAREQDSPNKDARIGRAGVCALAWSVLSVTWLWTAIVSDAIAGPMFFLHLGAVCLCLAAAANYWVLVRQLYLGTLREPPRP